MKKVFILIIAFVSLLKLTGQNMLETELHVNKVAYVPAFTVYACPSQSRKVRFTTLAIVSSRLTDSTTSFWAEGLAGLTYFPGKNVAIGTLVGIEAAPKLFRNFTYIRWTPKKHFLFGGTEFSFSNLFQPRYRIEYRYNLYKYFWAGATLRRYFGVGPRFQIQKSKWGVHAEPLYNFETKGFAGTVGLFFFY